MFYMNEKIVKQLETLSRVEVCMRHHEMTTHDTAWPKIVKKRAENGLYQRNTWLSNKWNLVESCFYNVCKK